MNTFGLNRVRVPWFARCRPAGSGQPRFGAWLALPRAERGPKPSHSTQLLGLVLLCGLAVGCDSTPPGTRRSLGRVGYDRAFMTARDVMRQYFTLEESSFRDGVIRSTPRFVDSGLRGASDGAPGRQAATMTLRREGPDVVAYMAVAMQGRYGEALRRFKMRHEFGSGLKRHPTPADIEAATTARQNESWRTVRYDRQLQRTVLDQLVRELTPAGERADKSQAVEKTQ